MKEPTWLIHARTYLGLSEVPGIEHNSTILRWWEAIKSPLRDDESPWCAAFVGGVLEECGIRSSRSAAARSYMTWGARLDMPARGCIVVFSRPPNPWSGHVGFVVGIDVKARLMVLGGNQRDKVSIAPFDREVLGYRWPMDVPEVPRDYWELPLLDADGQPASEDEA
jgi:uncharacterized protein (TIGR02594 family)